MRTKQHKRRRGVAISLALYVAVAGAALAAAAFCFWPGTSLKPEHPESGGASVPQESGAQSLNPPTESSPPSLSVTPGSSAQSSEPTGQSTSATPDAPDPSAPADSPSSGSSAAGGAAMQAFEQFHYYEQDKADRYLSYSLNNPELPAGDVVWHVNTGLDGQPYIDYEPARGTDTSYYIVNKYRKLPDDFVPSDLVALGSYKATSQAAAAYFSMQADAKAEGFTFSAVSAYRSIDSQRNLYNGYLKNDPPEVVDTYSARPGFSEHHTGRAIDLAGSSGGLLNFENTPECAWVHKNAHKYGFILRYPEGLESITGYHYEPWHITYVGVDIATDMRAKDIPTLEEYIAKHIDHRAQNVG